MLTDTEESTLRIRIRLGIVSPLMLVLFTASILASIAVGNAYTLGIYLRCFTILVHVVLTSAWVYLLWCFFHRLKGKKKEEFLRLYRHLYNCSTAEDIIGIAITIDNMAILVEDQYRVVRDFVCYRADRFLLGVASGTLQIPVSQVLIDTLYVLRADLEELPEYLSSEAYWLRDAASRRLEELQSVVH